MKYPIEAKIANPILLISGELITLKEIENLLCSKSKDDQLNILEKLGIKLEDSGISIKFLEEGKAYERPEEDRSVIAQQVTKSEFNITLSQSIDQSVLPIDISINYDSITDQQYVNFLAEIQLNITDEDVRIIPLTGRGTAALEGRLNDAHAGFCTGGACASFQQKVGIICSILAFFKLTRDNIEIVRAHLLQICAKYHGRDDILNYTFDKAFGLTRDDYYSYMLDLHKDSQPIMLRHFVEFSEPHPQYMILLKKKLTDEEYQEEMEKVLNNIDNVKLSSNVREIIKKFILFDGLYFVKPYPGEKLEDSENRSLSIYDLAKFININNFEKVTKLLSNMGVTVTDDNIHVKFDIKGQKILQFDQIMKYEPKETEETFEIDLKRKTKALKPCSIKVELDIKPLDRVNFFGKIEIKRSVLNKLILPLVGRGTLDLNGILVQNFSNFCFDAKFASFQQKVTIMYALFVLKYDVDLDDLQKLHYKLQAINKCYFNREYIIDYAYKTSLLENELKFFEHFRQSNRKFSTMPIALKTIVTYTRLPSRYYEELIIHFSEDELVLEEKKFEAAKYVGFVSKMLTKIGNLVNPHDDF